MLKDFTKEEALSKVGKAVQTRIPFFGLPQGTTGVVIWADFQPRVNFATRSAQNVWHVVIEWHPTGRSPFCDWLTKVHYEQFCVEES